MAQDIIQTDEGLPGNFRFSGGPMRPVSYIIVCARVFIRCFCHVLQEHAFESSQKYKEGKYIIEMAHMIKENGWESPPKK